MKAVGVGVSDRFGGYVAGNIGGHPEIEPERSKRVSQRDHNSELFIQRTTMRAYLQKQLGAVKRVRQGSRYVI